MKVIIPDLLKQEKILKTTDLFSYARYINYKPITKSSVKLNSNGIIYVKQGKKILHFANGDKTIKTDDIFFIKSGHYVMSEVLDEYYEALLFFYSDDLLNDFINKYEIDLKDEKESYKENFYLSSSSLLKNGLLSIVPYFEEETKNEHLINIKLEEIFLNLLNSSEEFKSFLKQIYSDNSFKNKVISTYEEYDTIFDLANSFKMSELNFRKKFKEKFDTTPKKWILSQKLNKAKLMLEQSELNVSEVCNIVGFDNISWFIQSFKKEFGFTPKKTKTNIN